MRHFHSVREGGANKMHGKMMEEANMWLDTYDQGEIDISVSNAKRHYDWYCTNCDKAFEGSDVNDDECPICGSNLTPFSDWINDENDTHESITGERYR